MTPPVRQKQREQPDQGEHDGDEIRGQVKAFGARQGKHRAPVLANEFALDLGFGLAFGDQPADVGTLTLGLWRFGHVQGNLAGHAHDLTFDRGHARAWCSGDSAGVEWERGSKCRHEHQRRCRTGKVVGQARDGTRAKPHIQRRARPQNPHMLSAKAIAWFRNASSISPREIATTSPEESITNVSGIWVVPYAWANSPVVSRRLG